MNYRYCLISLVILIISCSGRNKINGTLIFQEANPSEGFNFSYFLFIPDDADMEDELHLIVEPNNSGFASDNINEHMEKAERIATREYYIGNYLANRLHYPLLVPVFPRPDSAWRIYTHALDRDVMLLKDNVLERPDLQLIAMVEHALTILKQGGYKTNPKFLLTGFSASGTFANRFSLIHPDKIAAVAAGGVNGLLMLPVDTLTDEALNYPLGINDFESLFGKVFDNESFSSLPQFLFMGELDTNDAIPYEDGYEDSERAVIYKLMGNEMMPGRWDFCSSFYENKNLNAKIITYPETGHEHPDNIKGDILGYFKAMIKK